jgi:hypothetical protein
VFCGSGGTLPRILNLGSSWRWDTFKPRPLYTCKMSPRYPLYQAPTAGMDTWKQKHFCPYRKSNSVPRSSHLCLVTTLTCYWFYCCYFKCSLIITRYTTNEKVKCYKGPQSLNRMWFSVWREVCSPLPQTVLLLSSSGPQPVQEFQHFKLALC